MVTAHYHSTHHATPSDAPYIISLHHRVQSALTASGSLQELTLCSLPIISHSISSHQVFIFQKTTTQAPLGSLTISHFAPENGHGNLRWGVKMMDGKKWFLHSLMLEGLGVGLLREVLEMVRNEEKEGVVLDCWAGNEKLRRFYRDVGFRQLGVFPEEDYEVLVFMSGVAGAGGMLVGG